MVYRLLFNRHSDYDDYDVRHRTVLSYHIYH